MRGKGELTPAARRGATALNETCLKERLYGLRNRQFDRCDSFPLGRHCPQVTKLFALWRRRENEETIEQRVRRLTGSLIEATQLIYQIEGEIESRRTLVDRLQDDLETYNRIVELKRPEVEAVAQLLRGELQKQEKLSFWQNVLINFVFFALGAITSTVLARLF